MTKMLIMSLSSRVIIFLLFAFVTMSELAAQSYSIGLQIGGGISDTYYQDNRSFVVAGRDYIASDLFAPARSVSANVSMELRFANPLALLFNSGFVTKGYQVDEPSLSSFDMSYSHYQSSVSLRYYFLKYFHVTAHYELSRIQRAVLNDGFESIDLVKLGIYGDALENSVGFGFGYRLEDDIDVGFKYVRGLNFVESLELTDPNGNSTGGFEEYSQYAQVYITYFFYGNKWVRAKE